jgi:hypothetical protein
MVGLREGALLGDGLRGRREMRKDAVEPKKNALIDAGHDACGRESEIITRVAGVGLKQRQEWSQLVMLGHG